MIRRVLDGVPFQTDKTGKFCGEHCLLSVYNVGTTCVLERDDPKRRSRYDTTAQKYRRCPACLRRERKKWLTLTKAAAYAEVKKG